MDQYFLLALIIIGFWLVGFVIYLVFSNRQRDIEAEIIHIDGMLEAEETGSVSE